MKKIFLATVIFLGFLNSKAQIEDALIDTTIRGYHIQVVMQPPSTINRSYAGDSLTSCNVTMFCYINNDSNTVPMTNNNFFVYATAGEVRAYQNNPYYKQYYSSDSYLADLFLFPLMIAKIKSMIDFEHIEKYIGQKNK